MATSQKQLAHIEAELRTAMAAKKCWPCGCFRNTVNALQVSETLAAPLRDVLDEAADRFKATRYECLGCELCWPAVAQNLAGELDPAVAEASHCAADEPTARDGWPPLPGDYAILRFQAPVAVCTLNSDRLVRELSDSPVEGLSIVGSLHTENLGIEHLISNVLANPHIRRLIVCGEDTRKAIGHLPGQSLVALARHGVNDKMRITEAKGKRPLLKNLKPQHVEAFRAQVQVIAQIGNTDAGDLRRLITKTAPASPGAFTETPSDFIPVRMEPVNTSGKLTLDPAGYFVIYPDRINRKLVLEHYSNRGVLDRMFSDADASSLYMTAIEAQHVTRLDHAAYLGRELTRAERALQRDEDYVQDRAPGEASSGGASAEQIDDMAGCGCRPRKGKSCK